MIKRIAKVAGEENMKLALCDLYSATLNLRRWTKECDENYGGSFKRKKKEWESRVDEILEDLENGYYCQQNNQEYATRSSHAEENNQEHHS